MANNPLPLDFILSGALPKLRPRLLSLQTTIILMLHIVHRNSETVSKICKLSPGQNAWEMTVTTSCAFHSEEYILPTNIDTKASLFIHQPGITPTSIHLNYIRTSSFTAAGSRLIVRNDMRGCYFRSNKTTLPKDCCGS